MELELYISFSSLFGALPICRNVAVLGLGPPLLALFHDGKSAVFSSLFSSIHIPVYACRYVIVMYEKSNTSFSYMLYLLCKKPIGN